MSFVSLCLFTPETYSIVLPILISPVWQQATKGLAAEFGKEQIRVNALLPLLSGTGLFESFVGVPYNEENMKKFLFNVPLGRLTDPGDIANVACFLASDEGRFVTGVNLEVDGGRAVGS